MDRKKLLIRLTLLIFFIFFINYGASKFYWYSEIWWFDMPMHFIGGLWLGLLFIYLLNPKVMLTSTILKIMIGVLAIGILWELYEISVNDFTTRNNFNKIDTFSDICFDMAGGFTALFYLVKSNIMDSRV